ncbi:hypothetical protein CR513_32414, partial [Mucuna pruriens]
MPITTFRIILTQGGCAIIKSRVGEFWNSRSSRSSTFVTQGLKEAVMDQCERPGKSLTMGYTSPPYIETFGVPKALISDQGSHFCNHTMAKLLEKYGVKMANLSQNDWSRLLEDAMWLVTYWLRSSIKLTGRSRSAIWHDRERKLQLQELEELHLEAYDNSRIYKEKVKHFHDSRILRKEFKVGQKVLLFNSKLKLIASNLCSKWDRPFVVTNVFPYGVVEVRDETNNNTFKVNGHQLKPYHEGPNLNLTMGEIEIITLMELVIPEDPPKEVPECIAALTTMQNSKGGNIGNEFAKIKSF